LHEESCGVAKFKENVRELYLQTRDSENPDVLLFADLMDSLKDEVFPIVQEIKHDRQGMLVVLDVMAHCIVWHGFQVRTMCVPAKLVDLERTSKWSTRTTNADTTKKPSA